MEWDRWKESCALPIDAFRFDSPQLKNGDFGFVEIPLYSRFSPLRVRQLFSGVSPKISRIPQHQCPCVPRYLNRISKSRARHSPGKCSHRAEVGQLSKITRHDTPSMQGGVLMWDYNSVIVPFNGMDDRSYRSRWL